MNYSLPVGQGIVHESGYLIFLQAFKAFFSLVPLGQYMDGL
jgi:hypothetical protein